VEITTFPKLVRGVWTAERNSWRVEKGARDRLDRDLALCRGIEESLDEA